MLLPRKGSHSPDSANILCGPCPIGHAGMAELVDAPDSKSGSGNRVGVRFPLPAPNSGNLMKFCSSCGGPVSYRVPKDDNRKRAVCDDCGEVHYRNPLVVVGCVPALNDRVLLCKRAIEPRYGKWTLPAGCGSESGCNCRRSPVPDCRRRGRGRSRCCRSWNSS